eukprot:m51a1_g14780 hypothetical protein (1397) ;mRNA; r:446353-450955
MGAGGSTNAAPGAPAPAAGAPATAGAAPAAAPAAAAAPQAPAQAQFDAKGYDSDIERHLGRVYKGRREVVEKADGGGQFMAVKPWAGAIFPPSSFDPAKLNHTAPADKLDLQFIYGYRGYDSQDNASYLANGDVAYPAAAAGIVYNKDKHEQRHFLGHDDDIICMARHPSGTLVATGQIGKNPKVFLWNPSTAEAVAKLEGFSRAVVAIGFSSDGKRLAAVDMGDKRTITVHEVKADNSIAKIASRDAGPDPITAVKMNPTDPNQLATIAKNTVMFWTVNAGSLTDKRGILGNVAPMQPQICLDYLPNGNAITGTASGQIYVWNGNQLAKAVQAHQGTVFALHVSKSGVWSAGKDGKLRKWDTSFNPSTTIDLRAITSTLVDSAGRPVVFTGGKTPIAKSLFFQDGKLLVGTLGCELIEVDERSASATLLAQGHSVGETWGLAVHPRDHVCVTAGEDNTLRVWDMDKRRMTALRILPAQCFSAAYSPDGSHIAVGYKNGGVVVLQAGTLEEVKSWKSRKEAIGELKYSPNGRLLAVGSHDNFIDLHDAQRDYRLVTTCTGHNSFITHFDFSADSELLRSNCGAYELLFWRTRTGEQLKEPSKLRDVKWASHTCILGWDVQGIWPKFANGTDVNAVDLDHMNDTLVTADDFGMVNLFRYPVAKPAASEFKRYAGHSAHVTCCRFTKDDKYLMTTGGADKTLFQWLFIDDDDKKEPEAEDVLRELEVDYDKNRSFRAQAASAMVEAPAEYCSIPDDDSETSHELDIDGQQKEKGKPSLPGTWFTAIRPWLGAIFPPTNAPTIPVEKPAASVALDFVYGYRGHDARENLHFLANGEIVYSAAGVGIVMHPDTRKQRFFIGHTDDIVSLTLHPNGQTVATGQVGKDPAIIVWDSASMRQLKVLKGVHERAVTSIGFSPDGKKLVSVGMDDYHTIVVWDWEAGKPIASARGSTDKVFDINFSPFDNNAVMSCGVKHSTFWTITGNTLKSNKGIVSGVGKIQTMHCMAFPTPEYTVIGTACGELYVYKANKLEWVSPVVHPGGVTAIFCDKEFILTAGSDGQLKQWIFENGKVTSAGDSISLEPARKMTAEKALSIRSISRLGDQVVAGTSSSEVLLISLSRKDVVIAVQGLSTGEVWGLASHPSTHLFVTAAEDKSVRLWNADTNVQTAIAMLPWMALAAGWSPDGSTIAVGGERGNVSILNAKTLEVIKSFKDRKEEISVLRFSPDGTRLAIGSHDNFVDVYEVPSYKRRGTCTGHSSFITHLDWSADNKWLQTNCGAYELLFWNADTCAQEVRPSKLRDVQWDGWHAILGWPVQGIWPRGANGTDINMVARSHKGDLLASGDDFGMLKLFRYPAVQANMPYLKFLGHSAHVTNVAWLNDDSHIITTGGGDRTVFQWGLH